MGFRDLPDRDPSFLDLRVKLSQPHIAQLDMNYPGRRVTYNYSMREIGILRDYRQVMLFGVIPDLSISPPVVNRCHILEFGQTLILEGRFASMRNFSCRKWFDDVIMLHQIRRKFQASVNIIPRKARIISENILDRVSIAQEFEDRLNSYTFAANRRLSVENIRIDRDSIIKNAHRYIIAHDKPW